MNPGSSNLSIELSDLSKMERFKRLFKPQQIYTPIPDDGVEEDALSDNGSQISEQSVVPSFSWIEYGVFIVLGVAMLWAWSVISSTIFPQASD